MLEKEEDINTSHVIAQDFRGFNPACQKHSSNAYAINKDLVGFQLYSKKVCHFTAHYMLENYSDFFSYDPIKVGGYMI